MDGVNEVFDTGGGVGGEVVGEEGEVKEGSLAVCGDDRHDILAVCGGRGFLGDVVCVGVEQMNSVGGDIGHHLCWVQGEFPFLESVVFVLWSEMISDIRDVLTNHKDFHQTTVVQLAKVPGQLLEKHPPEAVMVVTLIIAVDDKRA